MVIYDSRSDEVYRFDELTADLFDELREAPRQLSHLIVAMGNRWGVTTDHELEGLVGDILSLLSSKNLAAQPLT